MIEGPRKHCIIKDAGWLQPLADPPSGQPLCREEYLKLMINYVSGVFGCVRGRNLFIYGKPGSGKTVCAKHLLYEIRLRAEETQISLGTVYVNAGRTRTPYFTLVEIVRALGYVVPDCGWQMFRMKRAFEKVLEEKAVVICLDEVDGLLKQREPLVYYLNRQPKTTLILVSNRLRDATALPTQVLSTLQPKLITLEPYTPEEAKIILEGRASKAFYPGTFRDSLLVEVARAASEAEDIRLGFSILLTAGWLAEEKGQSKVDAEDVHSAIKSETTMDLLQKMDSLEQKIRAIQRKGW